MDCPNCDSRLEPSSDDRGTRRTAYNGANVLTDEGDHLCLKVHCRHCKEPVKVWAEMSSAESL